MVRAAVVLEYDLSTIDHSVAIAEIWSDLHFLRVPAMCNLLALSLPIHQKFASL